MAEGSKARRNLSRLTGESGRDGVLVVPKSSPDVKDEDLVPGAALRWPPCACGHSLCPDYVAPEREA
ncbi:hypothetical protein ACFWMU_03815 [Streptomyces sp. NPDC058357]|uniref:hypothetical protein n=1 Tax=unclassified Streptomyces TaxID=2593676 RepID=UPI00365A4566